MRIVLEPGSYSLENVGDVAMLQVAIARLRDLWPGASVSVVTEAPLKLAELCPDTEPILTGPALFQPGRSSRRAPGLFSQAVNNFRGTAQRVPDLDYFAAALRGADLIVASGMGGLNDFFAIRASRLFGTLHLAKGYGISTALFSQGIGPVRDPVFGEKLAEALGTVDLIAVRERLFGPALLDEFGISRDVVRVTGDDAIELAYGARTEPRGSALGVNVRVAEYAGVDDQMLVTVGTVLRAAAASLQAPVLPIPISHRHGGLDTRANRALLSGIEPFSDGGATLLSPLDVIQQVGRCRVVIAGSYHAGVFALAQGIPVVGLVNSQYYAAKFLGLANMFGTGCEILRVSDPEFPESLAAAITRAWDSAEEVRGQLLSAAADQVQMGYEAYRELLAFGNAANASAAAGG